MKRIVLLISIFLAITLNAQNNTWHIRKPLDNLTLVSTFGELRPDHFHSGLDFSGHGHTGDPVHAIDDGYISRIKVSADGYGNALYIIHPNGKKSVYGHLLRFAPEIQKYVESEQYRRHKFEITLYPDPHRFNVKKGQVIGYVGNTGRSYGPHLHFEVRDALLDYPLNPLQFITIRDNTPPRILRYAVYPATDTSLVQGVHKKIILPASSHAVINTYGPAYFGIEVYDFVNGHYSRKAVYDVRLYVDDTLLLWYRFDRFLFQHTRDVNTLMDYAEYIRHKYKIQRSLVTPGNRLCIYRQVKNNGILYPTAGMHQITYIVSDFAGNQAKLSFRINALANATGGQTKHNSVVVPFGKEFHLDTAGLKLTIPDTALYDTIHFHFSIVDKNFSPFSPLYQIQDYGTPLRWPVLLNFRIPDGADTSHLVVVYLDNKARPQALHTTVKDRMATAQSRRFGRFYLTRDTLPPQVELVSSWKLATGQRLIFKIHDNLSGIKSYKVIVNRKWSLFAYDAKTSTLSAAVSKRHFIKGKNHVAVILEDGAGNKRKRDFLITVTD